MTDAPTTPESRLWKVTVEKMVVVEAKTRYEAQMLGESHVNDDDGEPGAARCSAALASILEERQRQDAKWGEQNHDPFTYLTILSEEVGELAQAALHARFGGPAGEHLRTEAVHTAAVALAIVECLDRKAWAFPPNDQGQRPAPLTATKMKPQRAGPVRCTEC